MNKLEVFQAVKNGAMTAEQAAAETGMTARGLALALRRYGRHLPYLLAQSAKLAQATVKSEQTRVKAEIAAHLNVTENQVNRLLRQAKIVTPPPKVVRIRVETREKAQKRRENVQKLVKMVALGTISPETAQKDLKISHRQMARYLSRFVAQFAYDVPTWRKLPRAQRADLVAAHG